MTVITDAMASLNPLTATVERLAGNQTTSPTPTMTFYPQNNSIPFAARALNVYYQLDTRQGAWTAANANADGVSWSATLPTLSKGWHTLYFFASDGSDATSINPLSGEMAADGAEGSPIPGLIGAYGFSYTTTPATVALATAGAEHKEEHVQVQWKTQTELDVVGFNVVTSTERKGTYMQVNRKMVPAEKPGQAHRGSYAWAHTNIKPGAKIFYKVEVLGRDGAFEWSKPMMVHVPQACANAPAAPNLRGPANGSAVAPGTVTVKWGRDLCASKYQLQVRRRTADGKVVVKETTAELKAKFEAPSSNKRVKLFWRVRACNAEEVCGPWSETRRINVEP